MRMRPPDGQNRKKAQERKAPRIRRVRNPLVEKVEPSLERPTHTGIHNTRARRSVIV